MFAFAFAFVMVLMLFFFPHFHFLITKEGWQGITFAAIVIAIFEAVRKYSLGMEAEEYAHTYLGKLWLIIVALYERIFHKAQYEQQQLAKAINKKVQ